MAPKSKTMSLGRIVDEALAKATETERTRCTRIIDRVAVEEMMMVDGESNRKRVAAIVRRILKEIG